MKKFNYKKLEKNIIKNKDAEASCELMFREIETAVSELAYTECAYEFVGLAFDDKMMEDDELVRMNREVLNLGKLLCGAPAADAKELYAKALTLRSELKDHMDCLMAYMDRFSIYNYVIQGLFYQFEELPDTSDYSDIDFAEEVAQELMREKDQSVVKLIVMDILKSLPVRMTKVKFYEHVSDGLSVYIGSDHSAVKDFLYQVKSAAGIYSPEGLERYFPEIWKYYKSFEEMDYKNISADDYSKARMTLGECLDYVGRMMDAYNTLATIVNELTVIARYSDIDFDNESITTAKHIIAETLKQYTADDVVDMVEPLREDLVSLEGVQEPLSEELYEMASSLENIRNSFWGDKMPETQVEQLKALMNACDMLSSNNYSELDREDQDTPASKAEVAKEFIQLQQELEQVFDGKQKSVVRAIMAAVLGYLPSHFSNLKKLQEHISSSLIGCTNMVEKMAHVEQIRGILFDYEEMADQEFEEDEEDWEEDAYEDEEDE